MKIKRANEWLADVYKDEHSIRHIWTKNEQEAKKFTEKEARQWAETIKINPLGVEIVE